MTFNMKNREFREGYRAFNATVGNHENPYFDDMDKYALRRIIAWNQGWHQAQQDDDQLLTMPCIRD